MRNNFGVGLGYEAVVRFAKPFFKSEVVFNDAIVDDYNAPGAIAMGMCVLFSRTPVSGPASMSNYVSSIDRA